MAGKTLQASSSSFFPFFFSVLCFLSAIAESREILVGGKPNAWKIPSSPSDSLNKWAENTRFRISDTLVWQYDGNKDSVLQVTREAYLSCSTTNPIAEHKDGHTTVRLEKPGPLFFISGSKSNCEEGQKLIVTVMSTHRRHGFDATSPAPSPAMAGGDFEQAPAVTPTPPAASSSSRLHGLGICASVLGAVGLGSLFL